MEKIKVNIKKPLYGNYVYIRGSIVEKAIRLGLGLQITVPNGTATVDPLKWRNTGRIMKKVFKFKDNPMILYGNNVPVPLPNVVKGEVVKKENEKQLKLL